MSGWVSSLTPSSHTLFGGVTLQAWTQREAYESFTKMHAYQYDTVGEDKFQYSVLVGSEQDEGSLAWMVPVNDFRLLHRLLGQKARVNKLDRELKTLTVFVSREEDAEDSISQGRDGDWMQLQGVSLRSDRLIRRGEEISFGYVGSVRSSGKFLIVRAAGVRVGATKGLTDPSKHGLTFWNKSRWTSL